jgi:hypothetical protein
LKWRPREAIILFTSLGLCLRQHCRFQLFIICTRSRKLLFLTDTLLMIRWSPT